MTLEVLDPPRKITFEDGKKVPEIAVLMDMSGSMQSIRMDAIGAFNAFLEEQQAVDGAAYFTLVMFDDAYDVVVDRKPIKEAQPLTRETFAPRGGTAFLDAGMRLLDTLERREPDACVLAVITDGDENSSTTYIGDEGRRALNAKIGEARSRGWLVLFLAANQDAIKVGESLGIQAAQSLNFAAVAGTGAVKSATRAVASRASAYRGSYASAFSGNIGASGVDLASAAMDSVAAFTDEEREGSMSGAPVPAAFKMDDET